MQAVGEATALVALESANAVVVASGGTMGPVAYAIKVGVATGLIEAVGWLTLKDLRGSKIAQKTVKAMGVVGVAADLQRLKSAVFTEDSQNYAADSIEYVDTSSRHSRGNRITFCGESIDKMKIDNEIYSQEKYIKELMDRIKRDPESVNSRVDLKYAIKELEQLDKERQKIIMTEKEVTTWNDRKYL